MKAKFITADSLVAIEDVEILKPIITRAILINNGSKPWPTDIDVMATARATNRKYKLVNKTESEAVYEEVVRLDEVGRRK